MKKIYFFLSLMVFTVAGNAQFNIDAAATNYTQNFDGLGTTGSTWTDNVTLTGWYARTDLTSPIAAYGVNTGSTTAAGLYSFGVLGTNPAADRALGYAPTNAYTGASGTGKGYIGWRLKNNTGSTISSIQVTWTGEQWRRDNALAQNLTLFYQTGATVTALLGGTWTTASSSFSSPQLSATALALDGNLPANRMAGITATITVTILPGQEIMLRWEDLNDSGSDHLLAIDDVTVNATLAPATGTSIITAGAGTEATSISSLINTQGAAILNFDIAVQDDGATPATDATATQISQLVFTAGTGNTVTNWSLAIAGAELSDGTNTTTSATIGTSSITFAALPTTSGSLGYVADNATKTYTLKIWLKSDLTTLKTVIDGQNFVFRIQNTGVTLTGSQLAASQDVNSGATNNVVAVVAGSLAYVQQPSTTGINVAMTPSVTVSANDANGNRDLDFVESVSITSTGTLTSSPVLVAAVSGVATFSGLTHSVSGTGLTLNAERTTTLDYDVISTTFNIINPSNATDYFRSKTSGNWNAISTWESSADNITWSDATLVPTAAANTITIRNSHTVTVAAAAGGDQIAIEVGATLNLSNDFTLSDGTGTDLNVDGTLINTAGTHVITGQIEFYSNGLYQHNRNGSPILAATWDAGSTVEVTGATSAVPSGLNQSFSNFIWNSAGQTASLNLSGALTGVGGNFIVSNTSSTAGRVLRLFGTTTNAVFTVGGNLLINDPNARLEYSNGNSTNSILNIGGNFNLSAGSFNANVSGTLAVNFTGSNKTFSSAGTLTNTQINWFVTNTGLLTLLSNIPVASARTLQVDGTLNANFYQVTGAGNVLVNGTFSTTNANGISSTGSLNNTGTKILGATSTIVFRGIGGTQQFTTGFSYVNVSIEGGGNKTLNGPVTITGNLNLADGIVVSSSVNLLTMAAGSTFTNASAQSYIDGPVAILTNSTATYTYPIGKAGFYKPFDLIPANASVTSFTAEYFRPNINTTHPACTPARLEAYTINERWNVVRNAGSADAAIRLNYIQAESAGSWTDGATSAPDPDNTKAITVALHQDANSCWEVYPDVSTLVVGDAASGQPATQSISTFGDFTFGYSAFAALPVKIEYIKGAKQGNVNNITWKVACQNSPTATMVLERSGDARTYKNIYSITETAVRCLQAFNFSDVSPLAGVNYYRLKMTDADGRSSYSATIAILNKDKGFELVSMSPNPLRATAVLSITSAVSGKMNIVITDAAGRVVANQSLMLSSGSNLAPLNLSFLPSGSYQVTGSLPEGEVKTLRFIKE